MKEVVDKAMEKWKTQGLGRRSEGEGAAAVRGLQMGSLPVSTMLTVELLAVLMQGAKVQSNNAATTGGTGQGRVALICYRCGLEGQRSNACTNPRNPQLVDQQACLAGAKPCSHCRRYRHSSKMYWTKKEMHI